MSPFQIAQLSAMIDEWGTDGVIKAMIEDLQSRDFTEDTAKELINSSIKDAT